MPSYQPALTTQFSPQDCLSRIVHDIHMKDPTKRLKTWPNGYRMDELHSHLGDVGCRLVLGEKEDAHEFIFHTTFTWGEKIYLSLQKTTFALTNFHLSLLPLRAEDETYYVMVLARYQCMASEKKRKRAETQRRYRLSREGRIVMDTNRARFSPYRG
ncbi:hypothetical protein DYB28_002440 [Aphanomyces astaci]|uniref:Uncharacterized protein n=1 Tax=Aphanomyces astaci TaxID=112090 RepID=A0A397F722_APHAT|nr:hypothetical protein DYB36_007688 [Aphanomyces astaci]RHY24525.1 hypothetical protein DYB25_007933 [Aphanomyces astaci]RHY47773.1 hypothetical protein DYB38_011123 [Aphanomyces astaci]RHY55545.1 hypothetical protein DYB30_006176 [Aphanomyces astaci]RHY60506.1 hypothetical protein DYB34_005095 [Aphanomyces astaci]